MSLDPVKQTLPFLRQLCEVNSSRLLPMQEGINPHTQRKEQAFRLMHGQVEVWLYYCPSDQSYNHFLVVFPTGASVQVKPDWRDPRPEQHWGYDTTGADAWELFQNWLQSLRS